MNCSTCSNKIGIVSWSNDGGNFCSLECSEKKHLEIHGDNHLYTGDNSITIGNAFFGNSRGEYGLCSTDWNIIFRPLFDIISFEYLFDNEVFKISPYFWGSCDCLDENSSHEENCRTIAPNFVHKSSGLQIKWYKYPFRESFSNIKISKEEAIKIVNECIESIKYKRS